VQSILRRIQLLEIQFERKKKAVKPEWKVTITDRRNGYEYQCITAEPTAEIYNLAVLSSGIDPLFAEISIRPATDARAPIYKISPESQPTIGSDR
jgi:hypothetical protein